MFGWPMLPSADLPGGGPAYPLSAPGVRFSARPVNGIAILGGMFNGTPVKNDNGTDPQLQNAHGTGFPLGGGTLSILEFQYSYPALGGMVEADEKPPLGFTYRLGAWYDSRQFADQRFDQNGLSLANPVSNGIAQSHHGDYAIYAVADQLVWRDERDPNRTVSVFARAMGTPFTDRNLIDYSANLGFVFHSPFRYRTDDTFDVGMGYAHVSNQAAALDRDNNVFSGVAGPVRSSETFVEVTYQYQVTPWLQLQPDVQYVFNPGAGLPDPNNPAQRIRNEWVIGVRANIAF
jgi:porin